MCYYNNIKGSPLGIKVSDKELKPSEIASKISVARLQMTQETPFFGIVSSELRIIPVSESLKGEIRTAAVTPSGICMYNPEFVSRLTFRETKGLLAHEALHPALKFWERFHLRDIDIANKAHDYAINIPINDSPDMDLPAGGLFEESFREKSAEEIFFILEEKEKENKSNNKGNPQTGEQGESGDNGSGSNSQAGEQGESGDSGSGSNSQTGEQGESGDSGSGSNSQAGEQNAQPSSSGQGDNYTLEGDVNEDLVDKIEKEYYGNLRDKKISNEELQEIRDTAKQRWQDTLQQAIVAERSSGKGSLPAWMVAEIEGILFPKMNFKKLLKRFFGRFGTPARASFKHRNRRNTFLPNTFVKPKMVSSLPRLYMLIDTSGSMWDKEGYAMVQGALGLIKRLANNDQYDIQIVMADTCITAELTFNDVMKAVKEKKLKSIGGGGSSFVSAFEHIWDIAARDNMCQAPILCITDGYIDVPDKQPRMMTETAWITPPKVSPPTTSWGHHMEMDVNI